MKKMYIALVGLMALGVASVGTVMVSAGSSEPVRPAWVLADGTIDYKKMPDTTQIPYTCWSGKTVSLTGKVVKQRAVGQPMPGSAEYELGVAKSKELGKIAGVVTRDARGGEVFTIDDSNPQVQQIMKKYEAKETPQCQ